tara:strand:- start:20156 stop:21430 length:1275 start_codon:yes stop_codon:yes gene_type:complete
MAKGKLFVVGLNHDTAPLYIREKVALTRDELIVALGKLRESVRDLVILSTCNRTELYFLSSDMQMHLDTIMEFFISRSGTNIEELSSFTYLYKQKYAINHLFRVVSGIDSLIIGESQILGQTREAYSIAVEQNTASGTMSKIFHQALRVGKRTRKETGVGDHSVSVSSSAVSIAKEKLGNLSDKRVAVLGAGEAGRLVAMSFRDHEVKELLILNRTFERAVELANEISGEAHPWDSLEECINQVDVVVTSTDSKDTLINKGTLTRPISKFRDSPLVIIDIAVPRDVDPDIANISNVFLFNMDDIQMVANQNLEYRQNEVAKVENIIEQEISRFESWWDSLDVAPSITLLRDQMDEIRLKEFSKLSRVMKHLSKDDISTIEIFSKALTNKFLHKPITSIKKNPEQSVSMKKLFNLEEPNRENGKG